MYLLLTIGWYRRQWWRIEDVGLTCTAADRESVLPLSLAFLNFHFLNEKANANLTTDTGIVSLLFLNDQFNLFICMEMNSLSQLEYIFHQDLHCTLYYRVHSDIVEKKC